MARSSPIFVLVPPGALAGSILMLSAESCCQLPYVFGVQLRIADASGVCPAMANVEYTVDGAAQPPETCDLQRATSGICSCSTELGQDLTGHYAITATSEDGARSATAEVDVDDLRCGEGTRVLDLDLE